MKRLLVIIAALWATFANAQMTTQQRQELSDVNALGNVNPGFENGSVKWTNAGSGTYATTTTAANVAYGVRAASWDAAAASDTLTSTAVTVPPGMYGANCEADVTYKGGDANVAVKVIDGSSNVLITRTLATSTTFTTIRLPFTCPTSSTFKLQFAATANAAVMYIDQAFLGLTRFNPDVSPVVYTMSKSAVGAVGSASQIVAGHTLVAEDFPVTTGKIAFWNLASLTDNSGALSCTSGTVACTLSNSGSAVTFTGTGHAGVANTAANFNGTTAQLTSSDNTFLNPGNTKSFAIGCWVNATDYTPSAAQILFGNDFSSTDRGYAVYMNVDGAFYLEDGNSATTADRQLIAPNLFLTDGTWHHIAAVMDHANSRQKIYIDGKVVATGAFTNQRAVTSTNFRIGSYRGGINFFAGKMQDCFFHNSGASSGALTDDDIRKLYAFKLSHNKGVPVADQQWTGVYSRSDNKIVNQMMSDWIVAQDDNNVWWDLSGLSSTSQVSLKLLQNGFTSTVVPAQTYMTSEVSSAPSTPITHGLPGRPAWVLVEQEGQVESTSWSPLDGVCWAKGDTQLNCDFTGLTIDSTHRIRITASMIPGGSSVREASATRLGLVKSYAVDPVAGMCAVSADYTITDNDGCETIVMTTGASTRTLTLPAAASTNKGRRIKMLKADSGAGTAAFSGTISGSSSNNSIAKQYGYGIVFSDGSAWYWDDGIKESGAWTPTWTSSATNFASITYSNQVGWYDRDGTKICLNAYLAINNTTGVPSGLLAVGGLPFTSSSGSFRYSNMHFWVSSVDLPAGTVGVIGYVGPGTNIAVIQGAIDNGGASDVLASANGGASRAVMIQGCYFIN